jgi:small conductance mechanosensitive channel
MSMFMEDLSDLLTDLSIAAPRIALGLIAVAIILVIYKIISRSLSKMSTRIEMEPHIENSFRLIIRVGAIVSATTAFLTILELPSTWFLGGSAIVGAALGFGSSQTINNIVAGFYVIISRPFRVSDYVKIGDVEGQVEEITINYTKLYTPSFNLLYVPNIQVMSSRVLNCTHEGFIKYTFTLDLPHGMISSNDELLAKCFEPAVEEFHKKYSDLQLRKPEYYFESSGAFARTFKFRIFIPKGEAKTLFTLKPELVDMIMNRWDEMRKK